MPPEYTALLDKPLLLAILLAMGAILGMAAERLVEGQKKAERRAYWKGRNQGKGKGKRRFKAVPAAKGGGSPADLAADQLKIVMGADFRRRALLNRPEANVFKSLDQIVIARNPGWQVMAQVSVGEFIACDDAEAYRCINSKRVDFVLMDEKCQARHALEYQGDGHHQGSAAARDAVKKEALRKAGVGYHEVVAGHTTPAELKRLVERLVPLNLG